MCIRDSANTVSEYHQQFEAAEVAKLIVGDTITIDDRSTYTMLGYLDPDKYQQTYDILSQYVDVSNIDASKCYTSYFYELAAGDEKYQAALDNFDAYTWDGTFEVDVYKRQTQPQGQRGGHVRLCPGRDGYSGGHHRHRGGGGCAQCHTDGHRGRGPVWPLPAPPAPGPGGPGQGQGLVLSLIHI